MNPDELIDTYCLAWSHPDSTERARLLTSVWAEGATYTDPRIHATCASELLAHIGRIQAQRRGAQVLRTSRVDVHHHAGRFTWHVRLPDGATLPEGIDFVELAADGRSIKRVIGFFGPL